MKVMQPLDNPLNTIREWIILSTNSSDVPDAAARVSTLRDMPLPDADTYQAARKQANSLAVEVLADRTCLPWRAMEAHADRVQVTVGSIDDLGAWMQELQGGAIHVSPAYHGVHLWVLQTVTPAREDGSRTRVLVSAQVFDGQMVQDWIRAGVVR